MQLTNALSNHAFVDLDSKHLYGDAVVNQLGKEVENGRLLRLLVKLSTITERADTDTQWAETGKSSANQPFLVLRFLLNRLIQRALSLRRICVCWSSALKGLMLVRIWTA